MSDNQAMNDHFNNGRNWEQETYLNLRRSHALAWGVAGVASTIALSLGIAVSVMLPLKEPVPYVITVDKQSGYLEVSKKLDETPLAKQEAITNYNLVRYVTARESYLNPIVAENYEQVQAMSGGDAAKEHKAVWDGDNPNNPSVIFGFDGEVEIDILSVSELNDKTSSVRFDRHVKFGGRTKTSRHTAIIVHKYVNTRISNEARLINPLGFKVTSYRVSDEFS